MEMSKIDFVIPWVDGNDPNWIAEKNRYLDEAGDKRNERFRDWHLLKYWFRGVEKNAPWVNRVYFITSGSLPAWLNTNHEKLTIVYHKDYIPHRYLPTFNSHTIELNIHRIKNLCQKFVYFNDDVFIINKIKQTDFFFKGKPCSMAGLGILGGLEEKLFINILFNNNSIINKHFKAKEVIKNQFLKFFSYRYGWRALLRNAALLPWCQDFFPGFHVEHGPAAYHKKTLADVWNAERKYLDEVCMHKFRTMDDANQYLFMWWQWCKGDFHPYNIRKQFTFMKMDYDIEYIKNAIERKSSPIIVLNDTDIPIDKIDVIRKSITESFEYILPDKSSFEL